ncbi:uncharacterized protein LOC103569706 [Microplitis demolitor]|uniref:uncharacterized protein LOC103569706 n=1 Tax=Microplitis demolitor TaxID=69319 RepID=UPI0004CD1347|nr:uncharacterized protein LOC103569706 [Microplitis demolitor]
MTSNNSDIYESAIPSVQCNLIFPTKIHYFRKYLNNKENQMHRPHKIVTMILLLLYIGFSTASFSKKDIKVNVEIPKEAEIGDYVDLRCNWEIHGNKSLYSVKWYKDGHEFFRYVPNNPQPIQTFPQIGVKLQSMLSRENSIRLIDLSLSSAGQYKCEVSTEGPAFATSFMTGNLNVVSLPIHGPEIIGLPLYYEVGKNITANCSAWPSVPRAKLYWTINDKPVPEQYTITYPTSSMTSAGTANILGLHFGTETRHFTDSGGTLKIRCLAEIGSRLLEAAKHVEVVYVNNQRLSASDFRENIKNTANEIRSKLIYFLFFFLIIT